MKHKKDATKIQLVAQIVIYSVPFWFLVVIVLGVMDKKDIRLQAIALSLIFAIILVADKNLPDSKE